MQPYAPERGDIVWLAFSPQAGREIAGRRPALTLSPAAYNRKVGLGLFYPITSQIKGYPYEVKIPAGLPISGVILADQIRNLDWQNRQATFICRLPATTLQEVVKKFQTLL